MTRESAGRCVVLALDRSQWNVPAPWCVAFRVVKQLAVAVALALVLTPVLVALLPDWASTGTPPAHVKRWPLPAPCPVRTVGAIWLRSGVRSELMRAFVELAESQLGPTAGCGTGLRSPVWRGRPTGPAAGPPVRPYLTFAGA